MLFMAEEVFDEFLVLVDGVEEGFDVHLAVGFRRVGVDLDEAAGQLLGVEAFGVQGRAVVEVELVRDLLERGVEQDVLAVQDDDRVDDVLQVTHLVGGDHDGAVLGRVLHQGRAELGFGWDIQAVGRLVEVEVADAGGEGEGDVGLLELSGGHGVHLLGGVDLEFIQDGLEVGRGEAGPELAGGAAPGEGLVIDGGHLVGEVVLVLEQDGLPLVGVVPVGGDRAGLGLLESAEEGQQRRLADAVLAQQAVDPAGLEVHRDVAEDLLGAVTEGKFVDLYHNFVVY